MRTVRLFAVRPLVLVLIVVLLALVACAPGAAPTPTPQPPTPTKAPPKPTPTEAPAEPTATKPAEPEKRTQNLEGETITLYHFGDISGPYAAITTPLVDGFNDAVAWLNEQGGIRGAKVEVVWADDGGNIEEAISIYNRFRTSDPKPLILIIYGSPELEALRERFVEDQIVTLTAGVSGEGLYVNSGWAFGWVPIYSDQFGLFVDWLVENWADVKPPQAGDEIKLGFVTWDTAYGRAASTDEAIEYAKSKGVEVVGVEFIELSPTADTTTALLNMQAAGANVIYTNTLAFGPANILKDATALGLREQMLFAGNNWAMDLATLALAGPENMEGFYSLMPYLWWDEDHPGIEIIKEQFEKNQRPPQERNIAYLASFAIVDAARQVLERAIDDVGFDNLDGQAVYNAITTMGEIQALDGVLRLEYDETRRAPNRARVAVTQGGKFVPVTDWLVTPDLRPQK